MQIVIDIPEAVYGRMNILRRSGMGSDAINYILDGIILPKNHGRLIDADDLDLKRIDTILSGEVKDTVDALSKMGMLIITAPTVIEADEAESEESE